jgi:hypothetical protein
MHSFSAESHLSLDGEIRKGHVVPFTSATPPTNGTGARPAETQAFFHRLQDVRSEGVMCEFSTKPGERVT